MDKGKKKSQAPRPLSEARSKKQGSGKQGISNPRLAVKPKPQPAAAAEAEVRPLERLQKVLAEAGLASRRNSEQLILQRRVRVNGNIVDELGTKVDPTRDVIVVDGKELPLRDPNEAKLYLALHKPRGYVTTADDERGRPTVLELVSGVGARVYPVGRLDSSSEGLLLLTNDGDLTYRLTHPRYKVEKEYEVQTDGVPTQADLQKLRDGVELDDGVRTQPAQVEMLHSENERAWLRFIISEGRNRQIRRMLEVVGYRTRRLIRMRVGNVKLGDLERGKFRVLTGGEVRGLRKAAGLTDAVNLVPEPAAPRPAPVAPRRAPNARPDTTPANRPSRFAAQADRTNGPFGRPSRSSDSLPRPPRGSTAPRPPSTAPAPPRSGSTRPFPANGNPTRPPQAGPSRPARPAPSGPARPARPFPANGNPARPAPSGGSRPARPAPGSGSNRPARPAPGSGNNRPARPPQGGGSSRPARPPQGGGSSRSARPPQGGGKGKRER